MKKRVINFRTKLVLGLVAALQCLASQAETYNFEVDFSTAINDDSSVWSYRYQANGSPNNLARDGNYELLPDQRTDMDGYSGINGWASMANPDWPPGGLPAVGKNMSGAEIVSGTDPFHVSAEQCYVHPAPNQIVVVSWRAPMTGAVRVNYRFADLNEGTPGRGDGGVAWFVDKGGSSGNLAAGGCGPGEDSGPRTISYVHVTAGDRINFVVDPYGLIYFDATRVSAEVTYLNDFDLERDFSTAENSEESVWSYRYQFDGSPDNRARDGGYELLPDAVSDLGGVTGLNGWAYIANPIWAPGYLPYVSKNMSSIDNPGGARAGQCEFHPAPSQIAVVSWQAPSNGLVRLEFRFTDLNANCGNGVLWFVDNGSMDGNLASGGFANGGDSGLQALPAVSVAAGDRINFIVDPNGPTEPDLYCDATRIFARITYIPFADFDFERDFSTLENSETSTWSYRYQADGNPDNLARDGNYELLQTRESGTGTMDGMNGWYYPSDAWVRKNFADTNAWDGFTQYTPPGQSTVHPNPYQIVVVSWLAPSNGTVRLDFRFADQNAGGGDGVAWYVDKGDASGNLASGSFGNGGDSGPQAIPQLEVAEGERINFVVDPKLGNHGWDATRLMAHVAYVTQTDYDFERDFSTVQNTEASTWSYRYQAGGDTTLRDGNYALLPNLTTGGGTMLGMNGWYDAASPYQLPLIVRNLGNTIAYDGYSQWTLPGQSTVHPDDGQIVVVSWLAPYSGTVQINYRFTDLNSGGGNGIAWYVDKGDASGNLASGSFENGNGTTLQTLEGVLVEAGERINFVIDPNGNLGWDATRMFARISYGSAPSGPKLTASLVDGMMRLSFDTQAGYQYTVEYTDALPAAPSAWNELFGSPVDGTGLPQWLDDPAPWDASTQRFYRLKVQ